MRTALWGITTWLHCTLERQFNSIHRILPFMKAWPQPLRTPELHKKQPKYSSKQSPLNPTEHKRMINSARYIGIWRSLLAPFPSSNKHINSHRTQAHHSFFAKPTMLKDASLKPLSAFEQCSHLIPPIWQFKNHCTKSN